MPLSNEAFVIGHNRDELLARQSHEIAKTTEPPEIIYPVDPLGGGTWICSGRQMTVAIINGSRQNHERQPPYRRSRGLVVIDAMQYSNVTEFVSDYDFTEIEPFTMIFCSSENLAEVHWDGRLIDVVGLSPHKPHIWASWTLYDQHLQNKRQNWFRDWYKANPDADREALLKFHMEAGDDEHQLVRTGRGPVQTISITSIEKYPAGVKLFVAHLTQLSELRAELS